MRESHYSSFLYAFYYNISRDLILLVFLRMFFHTVIMFFHTFTIFYLYNNVIARFIPKIIKNKLKNSPCQISLS